MPDPLTLAAVTDNEFAEFVKTLSPNPLNVTVGKLTKELAAHKKTLAKAKAVQKKMIDAFGKISPEAKAAAQKLAKQDTNVAGQNVHWSSPTEGQRGATGILAVNCKGGLV